MTAVFVEDGPDKGAIWHFGEPNKEQRALLEGTAWADLSHLAVVAVTGEDRLKWLHDLTTQHLLEFGVGSWTSALILDPQGHVEYQFSLVDDGVTTFIVLDPHFAQGLIDYLKKMRFMLKVDVKDASSEYSVLRAPGIANEVGGPYALVPRAELDEMKKVQCKWAPGHLMQNELQPGVLATDLIPMQSQSRMNSVLFMAQCI